MVDQNITAASIDSLVQQFAPQVYLYSGDRFRPSGVPWILQYAALQFPPFTNILRTSMTEVLPQGQVTATTLVGQNAEIARTSQLFQIEYSGYVYDAAHPVLNPPVSDFILYFADASNFNFSPPVGSVLCGQPLQPDSARPGKLLCSAPCYAHYRPLQGKFASAAITYNFFYPFNGPSGLYGYLPTVGVHVGDWEHITVYISPDTKSIVLVFFAAHGGGIFAFPGQFETQLANSTHVIVYSGSGGHPCYPTGGTHANKFLSPDETDDGVSWPTWQTVVNVGDIYNSNGPTQGNEWLNYSGRWGITSNFGDSPPTPSFQSWWNGEPGEQAMLGNSGAYQSFLLQTGTPIRADDGANNFAYWGVADYNGDGIPDLFGVKVRNTGSGKVEVHVLDGATNFQNFLLQTSTAIQADDGAANYLWSIANTGSPKPPLYGIKIKNTGTNTVEVHVLNGETNYSSFMFEHGTVFGAADGAQNFAAWDISYTTGSTWLSLFCTKVRNTGTEMVEMHILDGGNQFESFLYEHGTSIKSGDAANYSAWLVADYLHNGWYDLFGIKVNNTITGQVEVIVLDGGNELERVLLQADTPITGDDGANNFGGWALGDFNRDNTPDLFAIKVRNTGTGQVEVHVLNGAARNSGN